MKNVDDETLVASTDDFKLKDLSKSNAEVEVLSEPKPRWNTKNLGLRLGADIASAVSAASLIAPVIGFIDRSIMENASGRDTLLNSVKISIRQLLLRPHAVVFSRPFALIFALYGGTYLTANAVDTATSTLRGGPAPAVASGTAKFAASSAANVGLCIYKDQVFVRLFGPAGAVPRAVPMASYALFTLRDSLTIFASFNVPPLLAPYLSSRLPADIERAVGAQTVAQFAAPAMVQLVSTPLHLLGLDMYNRPSYAGRGPALADRWAVMRKNWAISAAARICRIVPAFGVGGTINTKIRRSLMEKLV